MTSLHGVDGSGQDRPGPVGDGAVAHVEHRARCATLLAVGTLACPECDAPVAPAAPLSPSDRLSCPYCDHGALVRDFLSLAVPSRPARVAVRVVHRPRTLA